MGNRLSKISTKTGDTGETGLAGGDRVSKSSVRIVTLGDIDELNCWLGMLRAELTTEDELQPLLARIQHDLFDLGGEMAMPGYELLKEEMLTLIEDKVVEYNESLPYLKEFILPGGTKMAAACHMARAVCRRAERSYVAVMDAEEGIHTLGLKYLNRLSDLLFVLARVLSRREGGSEVLWESRYRK